MSVDYIYWTFSAAAQSISAFVTLLIAGYAILHAQMDRARQDDDSLEEVYLTLQTRYHSQLKFLAWVTGLGVALSLLLVYLNRPTQPVPGWAQLAVTVIDLSAVLGGLAFVVSIVDPQKLQKAARDSVEMEPAVGISSVTRSSAEFFTEFVKLERSIRDYVKSRDLGVASRGAANPSCTFRQMIDALHQNERIDGAFYERLREINKYRNLVFHGCVALTDAAMIEKVKEASKRIVTAQTINDDGKPLYGCEVIGADWRFVTMEKKTYCVSKTYDSTEREELLQIISILRKFREILETKLL